MREAVRSDRETGVGAHRAARHAPAPAPGAEARGRPGDPRVRLAIGLGGVAASAVLARRRRVSAGEELSFRLVNDLPNSIYGPVWVVMQLGNVAAAPASAVAAHLAGERALARRLLAGGFASWALSKAVKRVVGRPRPAALLPATRRRGREQSGLGYLSGHAGVAVALGVAAFPRAGRRGRAAIAVTMPVVALCRLYVGAHLPLDVVGGASLGLAVEAATALAADRCRRRPPPPSPPRGARPQGRSALDT